MKKMLLIVFGLVFIFPIIINAKSININWQKNWGGTSSDYFDSVIQTEDGGFVAVGWLYSANIEGIVSKGSGDAIIVKYDKDGNMLWQKNWGGTSSDNFNSVIQTEDGGFVAVGNTNSTDIEGLPKIGGFGADAILVKYDKEGNMIWQKNWGGTSGDIFYSVIQTEDGGFVAVGNTNSTDIEGIALKGMDDAIIVKFDKAGNMLWQKNLGGTRSESFKSVIQIEDGGFVAVGDLYSTDIEGLPNIGDYESNAIIVKYDKDGNVKWQKSWGGTRSESFTSVIQIEDGGFITIGGTNSTDIEGIVSKGSGDAIIVKYDKDGNMLWQKNWGGTSSDYFDSVIQTEDGGFAAFGDFWSTDIDGLPNNGNADTVIIKYDKDGNIKWQKSWGGTGSESFKSVIQTEDGEFVASGYVEGDDGNNGWVVKFSLQNDLEILSIVNGTAIVEKKGNVVVVTPTPNEGYEVDKVIVKDKEGNVLDLEVTKLEDGTYSFELYDDVSVEVLFKEALVNPKTGLIDVLLILFVGLVISFSGFFIVKRYNERFEF